MRAALLLCGLAALFVACDDAGFNPSSVKEVTWKLESIERAGNPAIHVPNPEQYTLTFGNDGRVTVRADCNQCTTTYTLDGAALKVAHLNCTTNFCTLASLDGNYAAALEGDSSIESSNEHLVITRGGVTLRFRS